MKLSATLNPCIKAKLQLYCIFNPPLFQLLQYLYKPLLVYDSQRNAPRCYKYFLSRWTRNFVHVHCMLHEVKQWMAKRKCNAFGAHTKVHNYLAKFFFSATRNRSEVLLICSWCNLAKIFDVSLDFISQMKVSVKWLMGSISPEMSYHI